MAVQSGIRGDAGAIAWRHGIVVPLCQWFLIAATGSLLACAGSAARPGAEETTAVRFVKPRHEATSVIEGDEVRIAVARVIDCPAEAGDQCHVRRSPARGTAVTVVEHGSDPLAELTTDESGTAVLKISEYRKSILEAKAPKYDVVVEGTLAGEFDLTLIKNADEDASWLRVSARCSAPTEVSDCKAVERYLDSARYGTQAAELLKTAEPRLSELRERDRRAQTAAVQQNVRLAEDAAKAKRWQEALSRAEFCLSGDSANETCMKVAGRAHKGLADEQLEVGRTALDKEEWSAAVAAAQLCIKHDNRQACHDVGLRAQAGIEADERRYRSAKRLKDFAFYKEGSAWIVYVSFVDAEGNFVRLPGTMEVSILLETDSGVAWGRKTVARLTVRDRDYKPVAIGVARREALVASMVIDRSNMGWLDDPMLRAARTQTDRVFLVFTDALGRKFEADDHFAH